MEWFMAACQSDAVTPGSIADEFFQAEAKGDFPPGVAFGITRARVRGGMDTTMSGMITSLRLLAENPDQWRLAQSNPGRIRFIVDEALRYEAPVHVNYRTTMGDMERAVYFIKGDTKIGYFPNAANRDPRQWENPAKFDVTRDTANIHMSFGADRHICIGSNIARMEADVMLNALIRRVKSIELAGKPRRLIHNQLLTIDHLPLRITPLFAISRQASRTLNLARFDLGS